MKVIDLLVKIANREEVPKKVKVLDMSLLPEYQIITWNEDLKLYEYCDGCEFDRVLDKRHLSKYVEIIEDTPKEDKKMKRIQSCGDNLYSEYIGQWLVHKENYTEYDELLMNKINEIIDRLNGE